MAAARIKCFIPGPPFGFLQCQFRHGAKVGPKKIFYVSVHAPSRASLFILSHFPLSEFSIESGLDLFIVFSSIISAELDMVSFIFSFSTLFMDPDMDSSIFFSIVPIFPPNWSNRPESGPAQKTDTRPRKFSRIFSFLFLLCNGFFY